MTDEIIQLKLENNKLKEENDAKNQTIQSLENKVTEQNSVMQDTLDKAKKLQEKVDELQVKIASSEIASSEIASSEIACSEKVSQFIYPLAKIQIVDRVKMTLDSGDKYVGILFRYRSDLNPKSKALAQNDAVNNRLRRAASEKLDIKLSSEYRMYFPKDQYLSVFAIVENNSKAIKSITYFANFFARVIFGYEETRPHDQIIKDLDYAMTAGKKGNELDHERKDLKSTDLLPIESEYINQQLYDWVRKSSAKYLKKYDLI